MRVFMLIAGAAIGLGSLSVDAQANCNARGQFCDYPTWAANAFTDPPGRKYVPAYSYGGVYGYGPAYGYAPVYGYAAPMRAARLYRRRDWR